MGDRLVTIEMGRKEGGCCAPFAGGGDGSPHLTQCGLGRGLPPYQVASWSIQPFSHNTPTLQTYRQDRQSDRKTVRLQRANRFTNGRPTRVLGYRAAWSYF